MKARLFYSVYFYIDRVIDIPDGIDPDDDDAIWEYLNDIENPTIEEITLEDMHMSSEAYVEYEDGEFIYD